MSLRLCGRYAAVLFVVLASTACAPVRTTPTTRVPEGEDAAVLDAKLAKQWARYHSARAYLVDKVAVQKQLVTREDWENRLALTGDDAFTTADLKALRQRHAAIAAARRAEAAARSPIDLADVRRRNRVDDFCRELPKGGLLHVHPRGTLDRETARAILELVDPKIPFAKLRSSLNAPGVTGALYPDELTELQQVASRSPAGAKFSALSPEDQGVVLDLFFLPPGNHGFDRFAAVFTAISAIVFTNYGVDPEALQWDGFLARAKEHKVRYVEVSRMVTARPRWVAALEPWAEAMYRKHDVIVRLHASFARHKTAEFTRAKTAQLLRMPESKVLVGVNLVADETLYPALDNGQTLYAPLLHAVQQGASKLHRTAHAGELGDPRNVRDMMIMGAERVGHGVNLKDDLVALEYARINELPIEVNLISNLRLKVHEDAATHPFLHFLRLGLRVSLSTDDEGVFETTIDDECEIAVNQTDVVYDELKRMSLNSIETSFADPRTKAALLEAVRSDFQQFEDRWADALAD